jgi:hypothetical protein
MVKIIFGVLFICNFLNANELQYIKPQKYDFFNNIPDDMSKMYDISIDENNYMNWGIITASTLILIHYDEQLIKKAEKLGKSLGIPPDGDTKMNRVVSIGPFPIIQTTSSEGAFLYMIGDGATHLSITAGMFTYGMLYDNNKALSVSSQLLEGLIDVALVTQTIKHITGRESPYKSDTGSGEWRWFPNQKKYHQDVPKYDAFPSGHLATTMMTVTVLSENYPDNIYIKPVGYVAMGLLSFQMMNNGVHWASDYPLAIAIGYTFGKIVSTRERDKAKFGWTVEPNITSYSSGVSFKYWY